MHFFFRLLSLSSLKCIMLIWCLWFCYEVKLGVDYVTLGTDRGLMWGALFGYQHFVLSFCLVMEVQWTELKMCGWVLEHIYNENEVIRKQLEIMSKRGDLWKIWNIRQWIPCGDLACVRAYNLDPCKYHSFLPKRKKEEARSMCYLWSQYQVLC